MTLDEVKKLSIGDSVVFAPIPWNDGITMIYRGIAVPGHPDGGNIILTSESLKIFVFTHESNIRNSTKPYVNMKI